MSKQTETRPRGTQGSGGPYSEHGAGDWAPAARHGQIKVDDPHPKASPSDEKKYKDLPAAEVYHDLISHKPEEHHKKIHIHKTSDERPEQKEI